MRYVLPLAVFMAMAVFLAMGLSRDPRAVPSAMIDKPAPPINLPVLQSPGEQLDVQALRGQVWLLNVWASWCAPCREELPVLRDAAAEESGTAGWPATTARRQSKARSWVGVQKAGGAGALVCRQWRAGHGAPLERA